MRVLIAFLLALPLSWAQSDPPADLAARFDTAWRLVDERYWDLDFIGVDWDEVRTRYEPELANVTSDAALYALLESMYEELNDQHSVFVPPDRVEEIRGQYGDLPCLGIFSLTEDRSFSSLGNVRYSMMAGGVGYIALPDLVIEGSAGFLRGAVRQLAQQQASALILDLRGNPGGRLLEMMQAAGVFTRGFLWRVVTTWSLPIPYPAVGTVETELPLVVLIDGAVNSAAEGLAGALQGSGRATMIGETTAGNVEAVLPFCLRDGSQAWIATGVLAPLLGATWEGRGVEPDVKVAADEALEAALEFLSRTKD